jgi:hypothetical protein
MPPRPEHHFGGVHTEASRAARRGPRGSQPAISRGLLGNQNAVGPRRSKPRSKPRCLVCFKNHYVGNCKLPKPKSPTKKWYAPKFKDDDERGYLNKFHDPAPPGGGGGLGGGGFGFGISGIIDLTAA